MTAPFLPPEEPDQSFEKSVKDFRQESNRIADLNKNKNFTSTSKTDGSLISLFVGLIVIVLTIVLAFTSFFSYAFVGAKLWLWFVVPMGAKTISWIQMGGIGMLIRMFTYNYSSSFINDYKSDEKSNIKKLSESLTVLLVVPWITLLIGWILYLHM